MIYLCKIADSRYFLNRFSRLPALSFLLLSWEENRILLMPACYSSAAVTAAARSWIGTSFKHQGRLKKTQDHNGGVDCIGLIVGVARELNICDAAGVPLWRYDRADYGRRPSCGMLEIYLANHLQTADQLKPGVIALFSSRNRGRHVGIITERKSGAPAVIHAYITAGKVIETPMNRIWKTSVTGCYYFPQGG